MKEKKIEEKSENLFKKHSHLKSNKPKNDYSFKKSEKISKNHRKSGNPTETKSNPKNDKESYKTKVKSKNWSMSPQMSHLEDTDTDNKGLKKYKHEGLSLTRNKESNRESWGRHGYENQNENATRVDIEKSEDNKDIDKPKEEPNFGLSGKLVEETNKYKGVIIKYNEPPEARISKIKWRLYPFKSGEALSPILYLHRQSAYLFGRDRKICEIPVDHPSCSKQHAVLQFRAIYPKETDIVPSDLLEDQDLEDGKKRRIQVKPYIIDLGSANGTFLNNKPIEASRYYELMEGDVLKFGFSTREYVLLHETSSAVGDEDSIKSPHEHDGQEENPIDQMHE
ncbi:unnamed protein product [Gordionus sp. m RMFG-2023]|uniref:smad nuclear-interacting protein 1-like n=1 Tax=Gordionus sp. m RMFG-2023 TaxID=3053472 RepID=UPI0030E18F6D